MIVCDVVADEPSVLDLVAFSGKGKKTYLQVCKDIKPKELKYFHNHFKKCVNVFFLPVAGLGVLVMTS